MGGGYGSISEDWGKTQTEIGDGMRDRVQVVYLALDDDGYIGRTIEDLAMDTDLSIPRVKNCLWRLVKEGFARESSPGRYNQQRKARQ